jgi:hypothetical protein
MSRFSLVAFVASGFVHVKIITVGCHWTCEFRSPKVLRASVQLLQRLPFRPGIALKPQMNADERGSNPKHPPSTLPPLLRARTIPARNAHSKLPEKRLLIFPDSRFCLLRV